jgi:hypothetical protein
MTQVQEQPTAPFPEQHQDKPGLDSRLTPRPEYQAPAYKAAGKLSGKVALVTGGDSGIGRAVAVLYAREGADVAIVHLPQEQSDADETRRAVEAEGRRCLCIPTLRASGPAVWAAVRERSTVKKYGIASRRPGSPRRTAPVETRR